MTRLHSCMTQQPTKFRSLIGIRSVLDAIRLYYWDQPDSYSRATDANTRHPLTGENTGRRPNRDESAQLRKRLFSMLFFFFQRTARDGFTVVEVEDILRFIVSSTCHTHIIELLSFLLHLLCAEPLLLSSFMVALAELHISDDNFEPTTESNTDQSNSPSHRRSISLNSDFSAISSVDLVSDYHSFEHPTTPKSIKTMSYRTIPQNQTQGVYALIGLLNHENEVIRVLVLRLIGMIARCILSRDPSMQAFMSDISGKLREQGRARESTQEQEQEKEKGQKLQARKDSTSFSSLLKIGSSFRSVRNTVAKSSPIDIKRVSMIEEPQPLSKTTNSFKKTVSSTATSRDKLEATPYSPWQALGLDSHSSLYFLFAYIAKTQIIRGISVEVLCAMLEAAIADPVKIEYTGHSSTIQQPQMPMNEPIRTNLSTKKSSQNQSALSADGSRTTATKRSFRNTRTLHASSKLPHSPCTEISSTNPYPFVDNLSNSSLFSSPTSPLPASLSRIAESPISHPKQANLALNTSFDLKDSQYQPHDNGDKNVGKSTFTSEKNDNNDLGSEYELESTGSTFAVSSSPASKTMRQYTAESSTETPSSLIHAQSISCPAALVCLLSSLTHSAPRIQQEVLEKVIGLAKLPMQCHILLRIPLWQNLLLGILIANTYRTGICFAKQHDLTKKSLDSLNTSSPNAPLSIIDPDRLHSKDLSQQWRIEKNESVSSNQQDVIHSVLQLFRILHMQAINQQTYADSAKSTINPSLHLPSIPFIDSSVDDRSLLEPNGWNVIRMTFSCIIAAAELGRIDPFPLLVRLLRDLVLMFFHNLVNHSESTSRNQQKSRTVVPAKSKTIRMDNESNEEIAVTESPKSRCSASPVQHDYSGRSSSTEGVDMLGMNDGIGLEATARAVEIDTGLVNNVYMLIKMTEELMLCPPSAKQTSTIPPLSPIGDPFTDTTEWTDELQDPTAEEVEFANLCEACGDRENVFSNDKKLSSVWVLLNDILRLLKQMDFLPLSRALIAKDFKEINEMNRAILRLMIRGVQDNVYRRSSCFPCFCQGIRAVLCHEDNQVMEDVRAGAIHQIVLLCREQMKNSNCCVSQDNKHGDQDKATKMRTCDDFSKELKSLAIDLFSSNKLWLQYRLQSQTRVRRGTWTEKLSEAVVLEDDLQDDSKCVKQTIESESKDCGETVDNASIGDCGTKSIEKEQDRETALLDQLNAILDMDFTWDNLNDALFCLADSLSQEESSRHKSILEMRSNSVSVVSKRLKYLHKEQELFEKTYLPGIGDIQLALKRKEHLRITKRLKDAQEQKKIAFRRWQFILRRVTNERGTWGEPRGSQRHANGTCECTLQSSDNSFLESELVDQNVFTRENSVDNGIGQSSISEPQKTNVVYKLESRFDNQMRRMKLKGQYRATRHEEASRKRDRSSTGLGDSENDKENEHQEQVALSLFNDLKAALGGKLRTRVVNSEDLRDDWDDIDDAIESKLAEEEKQDQIVNLNDRTLDDEEESTKRLLYIPCELVTPMLLTAITLEIYSTHLQLIVEKDENGSPNIVNQKGARGGAWHLLKPPRDKKIKKSAITEVLNFTISSFLL